MSGPDPASGAGVRRPATARPRTGAAEGDVRPPGADELAAIERQLAELPRFSGASVSDDGELGCVLVSRPGRGPGMNFAAAPRWEARDVERRLAALEERFRAQGEWPALLVAEAVSRPAALESSLVRAGWIELERERIMWSRRPPVVPHLDPSTRLEAVTRRSAVEYEALERLVFGLPAAHAGERAELLAEAAAAGRVRGFLVRLHGAAVAVARLVPTDTVAGIYGVGVAPDRRRQGYGALVTAIATRSALATGGRLAWLSVSEQNEAAVGLYSALGYAPSVSWARWVAPVTTG